MKNLRVNGLLQALALLLFSVVALPVCAEKTIGDLVGPSLFVDTGLVKAEAPTLEEIDALVDELEVQFDLLMVEVFNGFTEVYLPRREQHSELSPDEFEALANERRALMTKWCTPGIDDDNQLFSLECRDDDAQP